MDRKTFLGHLEELIEAEPGTLQPTDRLEEAGTWDSVSSLGLMSLVDENFGMTLAPDAIAACQTPNDVMALLGNHIQG